MIAVDIETFDPNLHDLGDGAHRKDGAILMIGVYDGKDYVCCKPDDPRLADWLSSTEDKIFHNGIYDLSWLICGYRFNVGGMWHDTMTRCTLIDEYMDLDLDSCCKKFHVKGKNYADTIEAWFNVRKKDWGMRGGIWDNADVVCAFDEGWAAMEKYNRQDCVATYDLFMATEHGLRDMQEPYQIECAILPLIIDMKKIGVRIDTLRRDRLKSEIQRLMAEQERQLWYEYNIDGEVIASNQKMTKALHNLGISSPNKTATGADSWDNKSLPLIDHPCVPMISNYKNMKIVYNNFLCKALTDCEVNGRIYTTFKPTKRDEGGAKTGRFGSAHPNLQNISSRESGYGEKAWGAEMRSLFIPEEGMMIGAADYGQIEYRLLAHFAKGNQAEWLRQQCNNGVDMHTLAMEATGIDSRYIIKRMNFGFIYGMGIDRLVKLDILAFREAAKKRGVDVKDYADSIYADYHTRFPVIRDTMKWCENVTRDQGYLTSIGGRVHHRPRAELDKRGSWSVPYYKMTNYLIQGSASDILKKGLVDCYKQGLFNVCPLHLTVHDENVVSIPFNKEGSEAAQEIVRQMTGAYSDLLRVKLTAAVEVGPNWGYWKSDIWDDMKKGVFNSASFNKVYVPESNKNWWVTKNGYKGLD